jgi:glycosyltransferase involved in cell wall biosynthesis
VTDPRPIAIVAPRYAPAIGGVERNVELSASGLARRGIPLEVLTTDPTGTLMAAEVRDGVPVRRFATLRADDVYYPSPALFRWLWRNADRYRLIHVHGYHTLVPLTTWLARARRRLPLVVTPHYHRTGHTSFRRLLHVGYRPVGQTVLRRADLVLANSAAEQRWLEEDLPGLGVRLAPPGIDAPAPGELERPAPGPAGLRDGEITVLSVGRLAGYKQVDRLVAALPALPSEYVLTVVGVGDARDGVLEAARELGVEDRVRFCGHVSGDELRAWYRAADVFVSLSLEEAFGLTVLEAAAWGAPVVASDIPAHRESDGHIASGRISLVDTAVSGEALAEAIMAARATGRSTDRTGWSLPTWQGLVDRLEEAYDSVG